MSIPYWKKRDGFEFEKRFNYAIQQRGLIEYMTFCNPMNIDDWLEKIENGVDAKFKVKDIEIYCELSAIGKPYYNYKPYWFVGSRYKRFIKEQLIHDEKHLWVWVVSDVDSIMNYEDLRIFAEGFGVMLLTISQLIALLLSLIATVQTITHYIPNYRTSHNTDKNRQLDKQEQPKIDLKDRNLKDG